MELQNAPYCSHRVKASSLKALTVKVALFITFLALGLLIGFKALFGQGLI